jgi:hypothetical protein
VSVAGGGYYAYGLVEQDIGELLGGVSKGGDFERSAIYLDLVSGRVSTRAHLGHYYAINTHFSSRDHFFGCSARSDPGAGQ